MKLPTCIKLIFFMITEVALNLILIAENLNGDFYLNIEIIIKMYMYFSALVV